MDLEASPGCFYTSRGNFWIFEARPIKLERGEDALGENSELPTFACPLARFFFRFSYSRFSCPVIDRSPQMGGPEKKLDSKTTRLLT